MCLSALLFQRSFKKDLVMALALRVVSYEML